MVKKSEPSAPPIYPNFDEVQHVQLEDSTKDEGKTFRLRRISAIRETLEKELETTGRYRRRYKSAYNTAIYLNTGAGLTSIGSSIVAAATAATGVGIIASVPLGFTAVAAGVLSVVSAAVSKILLKKVEKHQQIKLIAAAKLSSVKGLVSRTLQDGQISNEEFQIILQEMESYRDHKSQIRNRTIGEVRKRDSRRKFKKRHSKSSRDGYDQPPPYDEEYTSTLNKVDAYIKFNLICCSFNN